VLLPDHESDTADRPDSRRQEQLEVLPIDAAPVAKQRGEGSLAGKPVSPIGADRDEGTPWQP